MTQDHAPLAGYTITIPGTLSEHRLVIQGRLPGLNEYTTACRTSHHTGAQMKLDNQTLVMWNIAAQMRRVHFTNPVFLLFTFYERDRRRDRDNVASYARKVIQDALVKSGTLTDDGWDYVTGYLDNFRVDRKNPRIVVEFIEQEVAPKCSKPQGKKLNK
jgi:hypothetical protein